jgi:pSer/pThr/pTyr-binding forkhead associated (FHA) protein
MPFFLKILIAPLPKFQGVKIPLAEGANVLGRVSPPCSIKLEGAKVSKMHCTVSVKGDEVAVVDHESANGVFVNGRRVSLSGLKAGDRLVVGDFTLEVTGS